MYEVYLDKLGGGDIEERGGIPVTRFPCIFGRHPECQYCLDDASVSRRHCLLFAMSNQIWVQDLGSSNGTFVNGERLEEPCPLKDGDTLRIAHVGFDVQLPLFPNIPAVKQSPPAETTRMIRRQSHHVLVVEDNDDALQSFALLLQEWGHQVVLARDGREALQAAREHSLDFVLMDLRLPGMDGFHVAEQLRHQRDMRATTFVAITGYGPYQDHRPPAGFAFDHVLTKPVDPPELEKLLSQANAG